MLLRSAVLKLYISYFLSSWGDRLWTFALSLILVVLGGDLRLAAINGFVNSAAVLLFGSTVGRWIDRSARLKASLTALLINNISVATSASLLLVVLVVSNTSLWLRYVLIYGAIALCGINMLAGMSMKVIVARDWVVVIADGDRAQLASNFAGCAFIAGWNIVSFFIEYIMLHVVYQSTPALAQTKTVAETPEHDSLISRVVQKVRNSTHGWLLYLQHSVFPAAFGLALLYYTTLAMDGISTGYAYAQGIEENLLAVMRAVSAIAGVLGSFAFPFLRNKIGLNTTGLLSLLLELTCLLLCVASIWAPGSPWLNEHFNYTAPEFGSTHEFSDYDGSQISVWLFLCGIASSRFGLWMADLSITQIMQENIEDAIRGTIFSVQMATQSFFDLAKSATTIALPGINTYAILILLSWSAVASGTLSYAIYMIIAPRRNKHIETPKEHENSITNAAYEAPVA